MKPDLIVHRRVDATLECPFFLARFGIEMAAAPTRRNISPTTVTGNMPEDLVRKIVSSTRFGLDMELYDQGIATLS